MIVWIDFYFFCNYEWVFIINIEKFWFFVFFEICDKYVSGVKIDFVFVIDFFVNGYVKFFGKGE